ncbi:helix-turn-helix domain-containing protein [Streptomyces sp. CA-111067]|uniref:helix-turn-helix domain-containing protein n=1 Tax=Streptomyces sp. CA-111067 TaxID=3240046 RepID=UPI003D95229A
MGTHIEEFAEQLRELKERSGRSYGMLATSLHVSTSTLHRYCNGAAVPFEYAPAERFARQCGASAEELVALHQRWLLADAAKRRESHRPSDAATEGESAGLPAVRVPPEDRPSMDGPSEAGPSGDGPSGDGPSGDVRSEAGPSGDGSPEEHALVGHAPVAALHAEVAPPPGPPSPGVPALPDVAHTPASGGKWRGRRARRTTVVLAAAAALAAVLPLVSHSGHGADDTGTSSPLPHPTVSALERPSPSVPASGRTHAPAGGAAPATTTATPSTSSGATAPKSSPAPNASDRPVTGGKPPFQVTVLANNWDTQCGQWFLLKQPPAEVPPPPSLQDGNAWAATLGGIPAGHLRLQLTAQGLPGEPVVLHAMYVKVLSSVAAPKGNVYTPEDGCGGGLDPASFAVDLDTTAPRARAVRGSVDNGEKAATVDFPFRISASDPQVLDVDGHTLDHDVRWYLDLVWTCGARQGTLRVDDHGTPFRTIGMKNDPAYGWSSTRWSPTPPDPQ